MVYPFAYLAYSVFRPASGTTVPGKSRFYSIISLCLFIRTAEIKPMCKSRSNRMLPGSKQQPLKYVYNENDYNGNLNCEQSTWYTHMYGACKPVKGPNVHPAREQKQNHVYMKYCKYVNVVS